MAKPPPGAPYVPPDCDTPVVHALKAWARGEASPDQQQRAYRWIVNDLAGAYDLSYRPGNDGDRDTAFAEGKRFVGTQIVKWVNMPSEIMEKMRNDGRKRS